jgi:hypothetical protein
VADIAARIADAGSWRDQRDAIVNAALIRLAQSGATIDFLSVQFALGAAFGEAAKQRATVFGCDEAWGRIARIQSMMEAP